EAPQHAGEPVAPALPFAGPLGGEVSLLDLGGYLPLPMHEVEPRLGLPPRAGAVVQVHDLPGHPALLLPRIEGPLGQSRGDPIGLAGVAEEVERQSAV